MVGLTTRGSGRGAATSRGLGVGWALLLVFGILGMHALVQHCALPDTVSSVTVTADPSAHAGVLSHDASPPEDRPDHSMVALCAAMLLTAGVSALVLFLGLRRGWPRAWALRRLVHQRVRRVARTWGTGPPYVVAFSVIRC